MITILQTQETESFPPLEICAIIFIIACVITHIHKLPEYLYNDAKIKQLVNKPE